MHQFLPAMLKRLIVAGRLTIEWPNGARSVYQGALPGPEASVRFTRTSTMRRVLLHPGLAFGEAYMDGDIQPVGCDIYAVLDVLMLNAQSGGTLPLLKLRQCLAGLGRSWAQHNPIRRAQRNVAHHYDLNGRLYSLFLDRDRQYSCAYFPTGQETLEEAQLLKKRHIAAKLKLDRPGLRVLDIGCGWGGMALTLAREFGAQVTGITLSDEQLSVARARAEAEGLADRVRFEKRDYRTLDQRFDRIVSVGMFEHVGVPHYGEFFTIVKKCLEPAGVALLHTIGRTDGPGTTNPWLKKYIFPGGYSPALSEIIPAIEQSGLLATDIEVLRLHYAQTIQHWRRRFSANRDTIASIYDERFCRMFEFYLAGAELAFRRENEVNYQIQLVGDQYALPLTRDYMQAAEQRAAQIAPLG